MRRITALASAFVAGVVVTSAAQAVEASARTSPRQAALQRRLARGWNTWNSRSMLSHVLLPEGLAVSLCLKDRRMWTRQYLREVFVGGDSEETVRPIAHASDGSYTELMLTWKDVELRVQSAARADQLYLIVTPLNTVTPPPFLVVETGLLWNRPGHLTRRATTIEGRAGTRPVVLRAHGELARDVFPTHGPYLVLDLARPTIVYTGPELSVEAIHRIVAEAKAALDAKSAPYGELAETYRALQTVLAWNTIYDAENERVITPISRRWNDWFGGWVLADWDNYFASWMLALDSADLAHANALAITQAATPDGFVPNFAASYGAKSWDHSQPPVGALVCREIYRRHRQRWFLEEVFDVLLKWNRWWPQHRANSGFLSWGSNPVFDGLGDPNRHNWQAATFESGLDNSPMYDGVPFDEKTNVLELADVGLLSFYVSDCNALAEIADVLGRPGEAAELRVRAGRFAGKLAELWDEDHGLYLNRRTDTGEPSLRLSPTLFYPLLAGVADERQARRMAGEHLLSPAEFRGDWMLPSIAFSDPAFADQRYWRGRIWAPMNLLVYLGLRRYSGTEVDQARRLLVERSRALLLKEWREKGHVHENYNARSGDGDDGEFSDPYYHWGALLGFISLIEAGHVEAPEHPLRGGERVAGGGRGRITSARAGAHPAGAGIR